MDSGLSSLPSARRRHHRARVLAQASYTVAQRQLSWVLRQSTTGDDVAAGDGGVKGAGTGGDAGGRAAPPPPPRPPATLRLRLGGLSLGEGATAAQLGADVFILIKCGPFWGRRCESRGTCARDAAV